MSLPQIVNDLLADLYGAGIDAASTKISSLEAFAPELVLCGTIVLMLLMRLFNFARRLDGFYLALAGSGVALLVSSPWTHLSSLESASVSSQEIFTGMLVYDGLSIYIRAFLLFFVFLFAVFTKLSGVTSREDSVDFYTLVLGSTLGMCLMASANHLLVIFLGVEMASVPSYALAGLLKERRQSSEAALKYAIYGAGAAGVMLYGISLLAGVTNSAHLPTMATQLASQIELGLEGGQMMVLALGGLMVMVGLAFKLSAVPFHFWCPDVFEGASAEVNAFLSVASKAAALALLVRVAVGFSTIPPTEPTFIALNETNTQQTEIDSEHPLPEKVSKSEKDEGPLFSVSSTEPSDANEDGSLQSKVALVGESTTLTGSVETLAPVRAFIAKLIAFLAAITCTFGNLAAYGQTNIKRLLAYSTIAHAGYMMMAVPAAVALAGSDAQAANTALGSLAIYIGVYLFMNLGAFAVVAFLRNAMGSEEIADYGGLIRHCPGTVVCFSIILFSLVGLPPLAGFIGKFAIFASLVEGFQITGNHYLMLLLWIGGINTAVSLFYYLNVVKKMTIDPEPEDRTPVSFQLVSLQGAYIVAVTLPLIFLFINWNGLSQWATSAASSLFT